MEIQQPLWATHSSAQLHLLCRTVALTPNSPAVPTASFPFTGHLWEKHGSIFSNNNPPGRQWQHLETPGAFYPLKQMKTAPSTSTPMSCAPAPKHCTLPSLSVSLTWGAWNQPQYSRRDLMSAKQTGIITASYLMATILFTQPVPMHWIVPSQVQEFALGSFYCFLKTFGGSCQPIPPTWGPNEWEYIDCSSTIWYHSQTCWRCTLSHCLDS